MKGRFNLKETRKRYLALKAFLFKTPLQAGLYFRTAGPSKRHLSSLAMPARDPPAKFLCVALRNTGDTQNYKQDFGDRLQLAAVPK